MVHVDLQYTYHHPFELLVMTYNSRFPTHKRIPVLLENFIKSVSFDYEKGEVIVTRRVKVDLEAPYWLKRLFGIYHFYLEQTLTYNAKERWMSTVTKSLSYSSYITITETVTWREHPENKNWTFFDESACMEILSHFIGFEKVIEGFISKSYTSNFDNARKLDLDFIREVQDKPVINVIQSCEEMIRRTLRVQGADQFLRQVDFSKHFSFEIELPPTS